MDRCTGLHGATPVQRRGSVLLLCRVHKHTVPTRGESLGGGEGGGSSGGEGGEAVAEREGEAGGQAMRWGLVHLSQVGSVQRQVLCVNRLTINDVADTGFYYMAEYRISQIQRKYLAPNNVHL